MMQHTPMKKQLNTDLIGSELREGSAFFRDYKNGMPTPSQSEPTTPIPQQTTPEIHDAPRTPVPPVLPVRDVPPVPPLKRVMKQRHPFDIWQDQYDSLQELSLEERKQGGSGSMSAMAREALDW